MFWKGIGLFMSFGKLKLMSLFRCFSLEVVDEMELGSKIDFDEAVLILCSCAKYFVQVFDFLCIP